MTNETVTPEEAAVLLRVSRHTVYRALRAGTLPGGKVGGQWRIWRCDLEEHLRNRQVVGARIQDSRGAW